jgi:hypothetical protein
MNELMFLVEEDPESGYNAKALGENIFTQADTIRESLNRFIDLVEKV